MSSPVEQIKERLSIVDVISSYLTIVQSGTTYKAKCPFHNEKTPSFHVSPERNMYYCFGCGAKGDVFTFVEQFEGVDFKGALKTLAARAGVSLTDGFEKTNDSKERLYLAMERATVFFEKEYAKNNEARAYLHSRGLSDEIIQTFRVGFAPNEWRSVSQALQKEGYTEKELEDAGLTKKSSKGFYDRFRGRIMFPILDTSGRVIAFSGRIFGRDNSEEAKYLNSPETPLFSKSHVLFGIDKAKLSIRTKGYAVVVEGQLDLLLSHQIGITNTVAVSGTALSGELSAEDTITNLGLIRRLSGNVIFAFDGDSAGVRAAGRSALIALSLDMQVKVAVLPEGKDPADIIKEDPNEWKNILKNAVHVISFYIDRICRATSDQRIRGRQIRETVFPYIAAVKSHIERSAYIQEIHAKTGIPVSAIQSDFESFLGSHAQEVFKEEKKEKGSQESRRAHLEKRFFGTLFYQEEKGWPVPEMKVTKDIFKESVGSEIYEALLETHSPWKDTLALEMEIWYGNGTERIIPEFTEVTLNLEEEILQDKAKLLLGELGENERNGDVAEAKRILQNYQQIITRIHEIKHRRIQ